MANASDGMKPSSWNPPSSQRIALGGGGTYARKSPPNSGSTSGIRGGGR